MESAPQAMRAAARLRAQAGRVKFAHQLVIERSWAAGWRLVTALLAAVETLKHVERARAGNGEGTRNAGHCQEQGDSGHCVRLP